MYLQSQLNDPRSHVKLYLNDLDHDLPQDGCVAVGKLKKTEEDLGQIKEKNIQLSDELLSKSRQLTALENRQKDEVSEVTGLRAKVSELTSKLSKATSEVAAAAAVGGGKKKSVSFAVSSSSSQDTDKVASLESALEAAAAEREHILLAAEQGREIVNMFLMC